MNIGGSCCLRTKHIGGNSGPIAVKVAGVRVTMRLLLSIFYGNAMCR